MSLNRVTTGFPVRQFRKAMRGPGMDTRTHVCEAVVTDVFVDPDHGMFADVVLMPSEQPMTCRVGTLYAGNSFGLYAELEVDDTVLVSVVDGSPEAGGWVIGRSWNTADPPIVPDADDGLLLVVKPDRNLRLRVAGKGNIVLAVEDGAVQLVGPDGEKLPMGDTLKGLLSDLLGDIAALTVPTAFGPSGVPLNAAAFEALKASPVDDGKMLSDHATVAK